MVAVSPVWLHQCSVNVCCFDGCLLGSDCLYQAGEGEVGSVPEDTFSTVGNEFKGCGIKAVMCKPTVFTFFEDEGFEVFGREFIHDG